MRVAANATGWWLSRFDGQRFSAVKPQLFPATIAAGWYYYQHVLQDHIGEWWGLTNTGLHRFPAVTAFAQLARTRPKAIYPNPAGVPAWQIKLLYEDVRGDLWLYTKAGLIKWERATGAFHLFAEADGIKFSGMERDSRYNAAAFREDKAGNLWIGASHGVIRHANGQPARGRKRS